MDTTCYPNNYEDIDIDIFKESIMTELVRIHMNELPFVEYPYEDFGVELYTNWCYAAYFYAEGDPYEQEYKYIMWVPCDGTGYCVQSYIYSWDTSQSPWVLRMNKYGNPTWYGIPDCYLPYIIVNPDPNIMELHGCIPYCY